MAKNDPFADLFNSTSSAKRKKRKSDKPKKPTLLKYPSEPKRKTKANMERYAERMKQVARINQARMEEYNKKMQEYEDKKTYIANIREGARRIKAGDFSLLKKRK